MKLLDFTEFNGFIAKNGEEAAKLFMEVVKEMKEEEELRI